jgi:protein SCO1/2
MNLLRLIAVGCLVASPAWAQPNPPSALRDVGVDQRLGEPVPLDLTFHDETGQPVRLGDLLAGMERCLRGLSLDIGRDYDVIIVSFDPRDTPAGSRAEKQAFLKDYRRAEAERGCHFLTGEEASIRKLADAVGFRYTYDPQTKQYGHAAAIMVLTPQGRLARYFYGIEYPAGDVRLALVEASGGKIGTVVDQVLLYCFHYDPVRGKYGLVITRVIQLAGVGTVAGLAGLIGWMLWREKRRGRDAVLRVRGRAAARPYQRPLE